jgi:hypothetical protein
VRGGAAAGREGGGRRNTPSPRHLCGGGNADTHPLLLSALSSLLTLTKAGAKAKVGLQVEVGHARAAGFLCERWAGVGGQEKRE